MNNRQVTELGLSGNAIGNAGCIALSKALALMPCIAGVDLGSNDITEEGGLALAEAVRNCCNPKWRTLCLDKNSIGDKAALAITGEIANGCKQGKPDLLDILYIKWNGLSSETVDSMRSIWASVKGSKTSAEACLAIEVQ